MAFLAPSVRAVSKRAEQEGDVVVLLALLQAELDGHPGIERVVPEVGAGVEDEAVAPGGRTWEVAHPAVGVGLPASHRPPAVTVRALEHDGDACGGAAARGVE